MGRKQPVVTLRLTNAAMSCTPVSRVAAEVEVSKALAAHADTFTAAQICDLVTNHGHINVKVVAAALSRRLLSLAAPRLMLRDTYKLFATTEYAYFQFRRRTWPVNKNSNLEWQRVAFALGITPAVYDGGALAELRGAAKEEKEATADKRAIAELLRNVDADAGEVAGKRPPIETLLGMKLKGLNHEEKKRRLEGICNYGRYEVPRSSFPTDEAELGRVVEALFTMGDANSVTDLIAQHLVSRASYHCVMRNSKLLVLAPVGALRYAMWMMLKEERLFGRRLPVDSRAILSAKEYRDLPRFCGIEVQHSPYFAEIHTGDLCDHVPMYVGLEGRRQTSGLEFADRFRHMTGGVLEGVDLAAYDAYLTGSLLVPCVATNPLEANFDSFQSFAAHHYPSLLDGPRVGETLARIDSLRDQIIELFAEHGAFDEDKDIGYDLPLAPSYLLAAAVGMWCDKHAVDLGIDVIGKARYLSRELMDVVGEYDGATICDMDIAVTAAGYDDYDKKVAGLFKAIAAAMVPPPETPADFYAQKVKTAFAHKWAFRGRRLARSMDVFKTPFVAPRLVTSFHLNLVKCWWDGRELRLLASCVCAALTGINQWYRWFSCNKDPIDVVLKYMRRGYSTLLEPTVEIPTMITYMKRGGRVDDFHVGKVSVAHPFFGRGADTSKLHWDRTPAPHHRGGKLVAP
jgi:hypothetical protein